MRTDEHYCELHDWKKIGTVTTSNATLAIVAPYMARTLSDRWNDRIYGNGGLHAKPFGNFEEFDLRQKTYSVMNPQGYEDQAAALIFAVESNGGYDVEARFCDLYGDGHLTVCELRVRIHFHDEEDGEEER